MPPMSAEATVSRNYLDWLIAVPWHKKPTASAICRPRKRSSTRTITASRSQGRASSSSWPWALVKDPKGPILSFTGPPGVGKTSLAARSRTPWTQVRAHAVGGVTDESEIRGHRKTYIGAMPGKLIQLMTQVGVNNPLIMIDEIDKIVKRLPRRSVVGAARSARSETEPRLRRSLSRDPVRSLAHALHLHRERARQHPAGRCATHGSDPSLRLHREREARHRHEAPRSRALEAHGLRRRTSIHSTRRSGRSSSDYTRESGVRNLERRSRPVCRKIARKVVATARDCRPGDHRCQGHRVSRPAEVRAAIAEAQTRSAWPPAWPGRRSAARSCSSRRRGCPARGG